MIDKMVPLSSVMRLIGQLCPECQLVVRTNSVKEEMKGNRTRDSLADLLECVSEETGIPIVEMLEKNNSAKVVNARRKVAILARERGYSYPQIGAALGKHHTTVIHLVKQSKACVL